MRIARQSPNLPLNDLEPPWSMRDANHIDREDYDLSGETPAIACHTCRYLLVVNSDAIYLHGVSWPGLRTGSNQHAVAGEIDRWKWHASHRRILSFPDRFPAERVRYQFPNHTFEPALAGLIDLSRVDRTGLRPRVWPWAARCSNESQQEEAQAQGVPGRATGTRSRPATPSRKNPTPR
jgi:hypothetical protein